MIINKIRNIISIIIVMMLFSIQVSGADYWTGNDYFNPNEGTVWGVTHDRIQKIENPGRAYLINDISSYSAHITNNYRYIGKSIENAFFWINKSRLAYVKLFKVKGGQNISFLFDKSIYLYCSEFNSSFVMVNDGAWGTDGACYTLQDDTEWIMVVFRKINGDLSEGSGNEIEISSSDIEKYNQRYILFEPFMYTLNMNGGSYMGSADSIKMERLGVEPITLPIPQRSGYRFKGWKSESGNIYNETLENVFKEDLFKDTTLNAIWEEIRPESISMNREYVIFEQNSNETVTLTPQVSPADALNKTITFSSSDTSIAKVDSNGRVTPGKTGVARITAMTANGLKAYCTVYVMGFEISVPTYCTLNEAYEININIYNYGSEGMNGRKHVILDSDDTVELVRVGDKNTKYSVIAESKSDYSASFEHKKGGYLADRTETGKVYYRLSPSESIKKTGDYEGNVTFTVSVL